MKRSREEEDAAGSYQQRPAAPGSAAARWKCDSCKRERDAVDKKTLWTDPNDNGSCCEPYDLCAMCHDADEGRRPPFNEGRDDDYSFYGASGGVPVCRQRRELWCAAHAAAACSERERASCCMAGGGCRVTFCRAVDGIPHGRHYREGQPCMDCRETLWHMVALAHPHLSKEDAATGLWTAARRATFPPAAKPSGLSDVKTYLACPFSEKDECKKLGARWDQDAKKWFVPPRKPLEPFSKWL